MAKTAKLLRQVRKRVLAAEKRGRRWRPDKDRLRVPERADREVQPVLEIEAELKHQARFPALFPGRRMRG